MFKILFCAEDANFLNSFSSHCEDESEINLTIIDKLKDLEKYSDYKEYDAILVQTSFCEETVQNEYLLLNEIFTKQNIEIKFMVVIDNVRRIVNNTKLRIDAIAQISEGNVNIANTILGLFKKEAVRKRILLVDDSITLQKYIKHKLKDFNYEVVSAYDGVEGLEKAIDTKPDLIITDIDMPRKDGYKLCKEIKQISFLKNTPVIVVSALGEEEDVKRGFDSGCDDYITKPFPVMELYQRIEMFLKDIAVFGREKILVVDDCDVVRNMIVLNLNKQGFKIIDAKDGVQGIFLAINEKPDIIITDCEMPEMSGKEMSQILSKNENTKDIPIIMLSSLDSIEDIIESYTCGIVKFISKPFSPDKILVLVERVAAELRFNRERKILSCYVSDGAIKEARKQASQKNNNKSLFSTSDTVAIMFSDIEKFTELSETLETKKVVSLLNDYFDCMTEILKRESGDVDKFIGDAIMALFLNNNNMEHSCVRAVRTAVQMSKAMKKFNDGAEREINIRIGINYGKVIIGDIGSKFYRRDYTVIGDNVNLASRLEGTNKEYSTRIIISESTREFIRDLFCVRKLDRIRVKGKNVPVNIYEVITDTDNGKFVSTYESGLEKYFKREWARHFNSVTYL